LLHGSPVINHGHAFMIIKGFIHRTFSVPWFPDSVSG
jgi:hypothetical protein